MAQSVKGTKEQHKAAAETIRTAKGKDKASAGRNWKAEGATIAEKFIALEANTDSTRWNLLMGECDALANNKPSIEAFLEGFGEAYVKHYNKDVAKVRKSEVKVIIEAFYIDRAKMEAAPGWHKRVEMARQIRPSKGTGKGATTKDKLTPRQADQAKELVEVADLSQANTLAYSAITRIGQLPEANLILVNTSRAALGRLKTEDKVIRQYCEEVLALLDKIAEAVKAVGAKVEEGKNMAEEQSKAGNKMLKAA